MVSDHEIMVCLMMCNTSPYSTVVGMV